MAITMAVSVCRKESTGDYGSVGASVGFDGIEIPSDATGEQVAAIHRHWLAVCEAAVGDELDRLRTAGRPPRPPVPTADGGRYDGPDDRGQARDDDRGEAEKPPIDGRQLLGWASKQEPAAKGAVLAFGRARGYRSKVVDWTPEQVAAAYHAARKGGRP
jgi:hypothetical protein